MKHQGFFSAHRVTDPKAIGYQQLAAAVIGKAFSDATDDDPAFDGYRRPERKAKDQAKLRIEARAWIESEDYYPWDAVLGVDAEKISRGLREAIEAEDLAWKREQVKWMRMSWKGHKDERTAS